MLCVCYSKYIYVLISDASLLREKPKKIKHQWQTGWWPKLLHSKSTKMHMVSLLTAIYIFIVALNQFRKLSAIAFKTLYDWLKAARTTQVYSTNEMCNQSQCTTWSRGFSRAWFQLHVRLLWLAIGLVLVLVYEACSQALFLKTRQTRIQLQIFYHQPSMLRHGTRLEGLSMYHDGWPNKKSSAVLSNNPVFNNVLYVSSWQS